MSRKDCESHWFAQGWVTKSYSCSLFIQLTHYTPLGRIDLPFYLSVPTMEPQPHSQPLTHILLSPFLIRVPFPVFPPQPLISPHRPSVTPTAAHITFICSPVAGVSKVAAHRCHSPLTLHPIRFQWFNWAFCCFGKRYRPFRALSCRWCKRFHISRAITHSSYKHTCKRNSTYAGGPSIVLMEAVRCREVPLKRCLS